MECYNVLYALQNNLIRCKCGVMVSQLPFLG